MRNPSTRTLAALAYERGEEFDPALTPTPALVEWLRLGERAVRPLESVSPYERRRERERQRRATNGRVPGWFGAEDLAEPGWADGRLIHGEPV